MLGTLTSPKVYSRDLQPLIGGGSFNDPSALQHLNSSHPMLTKNIRSLSGIKEIVDEVDRDGDSDLVSLDGNELDRQLKG